MLLDAARKGPAATSGECFWLTIPAPSIGRFVTVRDNVCQNSFRFVIRYRARNVASSILSILDRQSRVKHTISSGAFTHNGVTSGKHEALNDIDRSFMLCVNMQLIL